MSEFTKSIPITKRKTVSKTLQTKQAVWLAPGKLTSQRLEQFVSTILPTNVQVQLDQPFGKDSLQHLFYSEKSFCQILLPLLKSGYLSCRARNHSKGHPIVSANYNNFERNMYHLTSEVYKDIKSTGKTRQQSEKTGKR